MKVLVDSCVWSLSLRRRAQSKLSDDEQRLMAMHCEAIQNGQVAMIGPIRQEVLSGIKETMQFEKLRYALSSFQDVPLTTLHYEEAARLFNLCRSHGIECGAVDMLLCAVASMERCSILTNDSGLLRCMEVVNAEGNF